MRQLKLSISGNINLGTYNEILSTVMKDGEFEEIILIINSTGGSISQAFAIYDMLKSLKKNIITITFGDCMSIATAIFSLGNKRYIAKNVEYMIHAPNLTLQADTTYSSDELENLLSIKKNDVERWGKALKSTSDKINDIFLNEIFKSSDDTFLPVEKVLELKLATDILEDINLIIN